MGIEQQDKRTILIFTYGTLKRGFANHPLMQDLMRTGDAAFKGTYRTVETYPLVCGPYRVPFLLNFPGSGHRVTGELYAVSSRGLARVDELEGTNRGHYQRLPIRVVPVRDGGDHDDKDDNQRCSEGVTCAEAYYAHGSYARELWSKNGGKGFVSYSEKEASGYVKRKDRPEHLSFLDHVRIFVSTPE